MSDVAPEDASKLVHHAMGKNAPESPLLWNPGNYVATPR